MRKSYDGLASMVLGQLDGDPLSGDGFVFVGRDRRRLKVLMWGGDGFWIFMKRLSRGVFVLPQPHLGVDAREVVVVSALQWQALLEGVQITSMRKSVRFSK
jgi:transposase